MNLLNKKTYISDNSIVNFRKEQYKLINYFIKLCFNYLRNFGLEFEENDFRIEYTKNEYYSKIKNSELTLFTIYIKDQKFVEFLIPNLLYDNFFLINGNYYIPVIYNMDAPITLKKESAIMFSLFKPITIYYKKKENRIIFNRRNFAISTFLRLFFSESEIRIVCKKLEVNYVNETIETVYEKFSNIFGFSTIQDKSILIEYCEKLFLDEYTKELYENFYNVKNVSLKKILQVTIKKIFNGDKPSFIDLHSKRLVMTELLLAPLFDSVGIAINKLLHDKIVDKLFLKKGKLTIKNHFQLILHGKNSYDMYNGYSGFLMCKATFNKKTKEKRELRSGLPSEVSGIDKSYLGKICPISTSNTNIGESFQLVPDLVLKNLKFGIFDFN